MRRTARLQGLRLMMFEEVYGRPCHGASSQGEAGEILGVSERPFRRWRGRFETAGAEELYDRRLGRVPKPVNSVRYRQPTAEFRCRVEKYNLRPFCQDRVFGRQITAWLSMAARGGYNDGRFGHDLGNVGSNASGRT